MKLTICWITKNQEFIDKIRLKFGISDYMSINHETPCEIDEEDLPLLRECEKRGFIQIRNKWHNYDTKEEFN